MQFDTLRPSVSPSGSRKVCFCFQKDYFKGALRLLGEIPLPARSSPCNEVTADMIYPACAFQSKQQLAVFSSLCFSVDPLRKACNSLQRNPPDIPTHCFSDTHSAALVKQFCCNKKRAKKANPLFKPHRSLHLMSIKFPFVKYHNNKKKRVIRGIYLCQLAAYFTILWWK